MAVRRLVWICAAAGILVAGGCRGGIGKPMCAADAGARACLIPTSTAHSYGLTATGFQPNSELLLTLPPSVDPGTSVPLRFHIGGDGTFADTGGGRLGLAGSGALTVTLSGTAASGAAVSVSIVVRR
ncbi:MAG: hypothetical protein QOE57_744 [Acidimicrobiaceae bacterium]|jgi:hypothetical protein|nr:hypothetical protein [Acidimicrobiaceae bacterium]MDQ1378866.1 hypothetical protein [Acidimicrobiaceae bacterium]